MLVWATYDIVSAILADTWDSLSDDEWRDYILNISDL